jgi:tetratricopeptide (TPR) repeat protein
VADPNNSSSPDQSSPEAASPTGAGDNAGAKLFVAREADLAVLQGHWSAARGGAGRSILLSGALGSGKRALVGELCRGALAQDEDTLLWRVALHDEEDGLQTLLRIYAGLLQALHRSPMLRGRVEMALNAQIPNQPKRVQLWYQAFIEGLKKGAPKPGEDQFQVILPKDNPFACIVEIATAISRKFPIICELQNLHHVQSLIIHAMVEGLVDELKAQSGSRMLLILGIEPVTDAAKAWFSAPLLDMLDRRKDDLTAIEMTPWAEEEAGRYLSSKGLSTDKAADIARIAGGRPGFIAELVDHLVAEEELDADLSERSLGTLADVTPDEDEVGEAGEVGEGEAKRRKVGAEDAERVAFLGALLGLSFPSGLLADMAGFDRESVDDLLDATEGVYKELQFSQPLNTWIYQFNRALLRESVLARHTSDEDRNVAQRVGLFLERFLAPRGYAYLVKTMRIFAEYGALNRAALLRSSALGHDQPQTWAMTHDLVKYFVDVSWPDAMRRTIYMNLLDRMVQAGDVNQAEGLNTEALAWANSKEDRNMEAWLLFAGSRLDLRRQDVYRARDRANDAIRVYHGLGNKVQEAHVRSHLAMVELQDGNPNAALDQVKQAEELAAQPDVQAHAEFVRGLAMRRDKSQVKAAIDHFRQANEIAGRSNLGPLALEAGLALGETLLVSGDAAKAADVLGQVSRIAQQLKNPARERSASALLAQSHANLKNYEAAITAANRTLQLTKELKFERLIAVDIYNLGFFHLAMGRATEAVSLFRQARQGADATDGAFQKELLFNLGRALDQIGEKTQAEEAFKTMMGPANAAKDWQKVFVGAQVLAGYDEARGNKSGARSHLETALRAADAAGMKEEHKALRRRIDGLK